MILCHISKLYDLMLISHVLSYNFRHGKSPTFSEKVPINLHQWFIYKVSILTYWSKDFRLFWTCHCDFCNVKIHLSSLQCDINISKQTIKENIYLYISYKIFTVRSNLSSFRWLLLCKHKRCHHLASNLCQNATHDLLEMLSRQQQRNVYLRRIFHILIIFEWS